MQATKRMTEAVCQQYASAIQDANGNEVFAVGFIDESGMVCKIEICARGNNSAVPVTKKKDAIFNASVLIHNHPSGTLEPSIQDLRIAQTSAENGQGFIICNNSVTRIYVVVEPILSRKKEKLKTEYIASLLQKGGALNKLSTHFEERPAQVALIKSICHAFNENKIGIYEAGTGVGKSYAYIIPSMLWALSNKERVILSTGTINLQQQLIEKDIPSAEKIIGKKIKAVLMKGRQNYVCMRRLNEAGKERDLFDDDVEQFDALASWAKKSKTGSRSDLSFFPSESVWSRVNSEADGCFGMRCPFFEKCFVMKIRKEASDAQLIVVNHHLLFADLEARLAGAGYDDTAVLPPFRRIVFDEAHGMENAATSFFSEQINRFKIIKQLNLLYRTRRGAIAGHICTLEALSNKSDFVEKVPILIDAIKTKIALLEDEALLLMPYDFSFRICKENAQDVSNLINAFADLKQALTNLINTVRLIIDGIDEKNLDSPAVWETKQVLNRLDDANGVCKQFTDWHENPATIFWFDKVRYKNKNGSGIYPRFYATPLDIAPKMQAGVFEPLETVVCTSATLKTGNSFAYWLNRTGAQFVEDERRDTNAFESPFPYETNMLLAIPTDIPLPDSSDFQSCVESAIIDLICAIGGKTLVLFTSYESLISACEASRAVLGMQGITLLRQGDDDRFRLLESFKQDTSSVLFATDSFWEGVDVPGDALSQVIIVKLPFSVPKDPVFAARSEAITARGGNPFMELSVPEAVIKFRQGFGRLMRRSSDRGAVVVLDRRIVEKRYGSIFLSSIPKTRRITEPLSSVVRAVDAFINC